MQVPHYQTLFCWQRRQCSGVVVIELRKEVATNIKIAKVTPELELHFTREVQRGVAVVTR